jgi:hypothetical protein
LCATWRTADLRDTKCKSIPFGGEYSCNTQSLLGRDADYKYLVYRVWMRHLHYTHNLDGEPPPPVIKPSKKGP